MPGRVRESSRAGPAYRRSGPGRGARRRQGRAHRRGWERCRSTGCRDGPIIGIVKATRADSDVFITTTSADVVALSDAGADIIAFDATQRPRPETVASLCGTVQQRGRASMADISAIDEAKAAIAAGADLVGTTLSGYTDYSPALEGPDFELMQELHHGGVSFAAEGRIWTPDEAARAIALGARFVVVGSAITRPDVIARRFSDAVVRRAADPLTIGDRRWAGSTASQ
jgi:N-acylglucosamine-6-phosphate 2-epimerase